MPKKSTQKAPTLKVTKRKPTDSEAAAQTVDAAIAKTAKEQAQIESDNMTAAISFHKECCERFGFADNANSFLKTSAILNEVKVALIRDSIEAVGEAGGFPVNLEKSLPSIHLNRAANQSFLEAAIKTASESIELRLIEKRAAERIAPA